MRSSSSTAGYVPRRGDARASTSSSPTSPICKRSGTSVKAILLSHGHEDHIGALPYLLQTAATCPSTAPASPWAWSKPKLEEHGLLGDAELHEIEAGRRLRLGAFDLEFIHVNHSIADVVGHRHHDPGGAHPLRHRLQVRPHAHRRQGDRLAAPGRAGQRRASSACCRTAPTPSGPGYTLSERTVGDDADRGVPRGRGADRRRHLRLQHPPDPAGARRRRRFGRKVCVDRPEHGEERRHRRAPGLPDDSRRDPDRRRRARRATRPTRWSSSPPAARASRWRRSTRMAMNEHRQIDHRAGRHGDHLGHARSPATRGRSARTINHLFRQGADVIYHARRAACTSRATRARKS